MRRPISEVPLTPASRTTAAVSAAVVEAIASGLFAESDALPSTRRLAAQVGCSRSVAVSAYDELAAAGYVNATAGSGTRVAPGAGRAARARLATRVETGVADDAATRPVSRISPHGTEARRIGLASGQPDVSLIHDGDWRRAWRAASREPVSADLPWLAPGDQPLVGALVDHLRRHRGFVADTVLLAPGSAAATTALAAAAGLPVVVEDPGYVRARQAIALAGVACEPCPVDDEGLVVDALPRSPRLVYVTPAHQFPLGVRMSVQRRLDLLAWAHETGSVVIEDDYDGEFRYGVAPLPALRSLPGAEHVVAYVGTASKVLTPSLQAAWIVPPPAVRSGMVEELQTRRLGVPAINAAALATFIQSGALDRHIARAGRTYSARRAALIRALHDHLLEPRLGGIEAGLHVRLDLDLDDESVARLLAERGIDAEPLSRSAIVASSRGLVLGYARLPETQADQVARAIAEAVATVQRGQAATPLTQ